MDTTRTTRKGYWFIISAILLCPCHLPLILAVAGGTILGGILSDHFAVIFVGLSLYFFLALTYGLRLLKQQQKDS